MAVFVIVRAQLRPFGLRRQRLRRRLGARGDLGDQAFLPGEAMQLPDAERDEKGAAEQRRDGWPEQAASGIGAGRRRASIAEPPLFGLGLILPGDEQPLQGPQQAEADDDG